MVGGDWRPCATGFRGYPRSYITDGLVAGIGRLGTGAPRKPREVSIDLSGAIVSAWTHEKLQTVLQWIIAEKGHLTRIDIAFDDRNGSVPMTHIHCAIEAGQIVTRAKEVRFNNRKSIKGNLQGITVVVGSSASETMLRIYDKQLEMKHKKRPNWLEFGIRWELQNRKSRAKALGIQLSLLAWKEWLQYLIGYLRSYINFRATTMEASRAQRSRAPLLPWWRQLTESLGKAHLAVERPKEWDLTDLKRSLMPFMPNLAALVQCPGGRDWLEQQMRVGATRMKPKHHRLVNQLTRESDQSVEELYEVLQEAGSY